MKHAMRCFSLLVLLALLLTGCVHKEPDENEAVFCTVTFDANGGTAVPSMTVEKGSKIAAPLEPTRENYIFDGWKNGNEKWDFSFHSVQGDMTLRAQWRSADSIFDYRTVANTDTVYLTALKGEYTTVVVPETIKGFSVVGLDEGIFSDLSSDTVKKIVLPETVTEIGDEAFANAAGIEIVVKGALSSIGERAFFGCDGLKTVCLSDQITRIPVECFAGSGLSQVILSDRVTVIEEGAFQNCAALKTVVLHGSMANTDAFFAVEDSAFRDCTALKTVFLYGTETDREALLAKTDNQNTPLADATFCYYSEQEPTGEGNYWYMNDGEPRVW